LTCHFNCFGTTTHVWHMRPSSSEERRMSCRGGMCPVASKD
jgi:hypothetical protein